MNTKSTGSGLALYQHVSEYGTDKKFFLPKDYEQASLIQNDKSWGGSTVRGYMVDKDGYVSPDCGVRLHRLRLVGYLTHDEYAKMRDLNEALYAKRKFEALIGNIKK